MKPSSPVSFVVGLALWWVPLVRLSAQQPVVTEPTQVLETFLTSVLEHRWSDAARLLDSEALLKIRKRYLNEPSMWSPPWPMTVEDYQRGQPDMPREVAEYFARRATATAGYRPHYIHEFGLDSITQLLHLAPDDLARTWVKAHDGAYQMTQRLKAAGCPAPLALDSIFRANKVQIYGAVQAGPKRVYVLFRGGMLGDLVTDEVFVRPPAIAGLRLTDAGWRLTPEEDLLNEFSGGFYQVGCPSRPH